jgi:hypothetical protein
MKIFVSHAIKDNKLINDLKLSLEPHGLKLLIAEHHSDVNFATITDKIEKIIASSDVALFLLTDNGFNSNFVQQEIGYVKSLKIPYLQVIEKGIENKITGFNYGKGYIEYSPNEPQVTIDKIKRSLINYWNKQQLIKQEQIKKEQTKQLQVMLQRQKEEEQAMKVGLGVLAGVLVLAMISK